MHLGRSGITLVLDSSRLASGIGEIVPIYHTHFMLSPSLEAIRMKVYRERSAVNDARHAYQYHLN